MSETDALPYGPLGTATTTGHQWPPLFKAQHIVSGFVWSKGRMRFFASLFDHCDHEDNDACMSLGGQGNRSPKRTQNRE